jgi:ribosome recycling factor
MLKEKLISEDEERQALDSIQKLTDSQIAKADQVAKAKEKEILEFK